MICTSGDGLDAGNGSTLLATKTICQVEDIHLLSIEAEETMISGETLTRTGSGGVEVRGFLHRPLDASGDGLVLTHGAGANCQSALLTWLAQAFSERGLTVLRCDLPFRQLRPHGPPRPGSAARDQQGLRDAVTALREFASGRVFLGGHSYGGRQATMLAANEPGVADALLLLSYPLHPPMKPTQLRTAHFPQLQTPALFVHGTRDGFGSSEELTQALRVVPARTDLLQIAGAGHELVKSKTPTNVINDICSAFQAFAAHSKVSS